MPTDPIYLVGSGGHAKVVLDALLRATPGCAVELLDQNPDRHGAVVLGRSVIAPFEVSRVRGHRFHVAIGANDVRQRLTQALTAAGGQALTIIHPDASVSSHATLGPGSFVAARGVLGPGATAGEGVIINHGAVVDHDCTVGDFCHVAPQASLAGSVRTAERVLFGAGANVLPGVQIGAGAIVGAGAVVTGNVPENATWVGVPARPVGEAK